MSICIECRRLLADSQVWRRRAKEADARAEEFEEELVAALAELAAQTQQRDAAESSALHWKLDAGQAREELAALEARRCEGCFWWRETAPTFHPGRMDCDHHPPISVGDTIPPSDFACNRWTDRAEEENRTPYGHHGSGCGCSWCKSARAEEGTP
jgi:hypothetical protein